jgi:hypothetical protein
MRYCALSLSSSFPIRTLLQTTNKALLIYDVHLSSQDSVYDLRDIDTSLSRGAPELHRDDNRPRVKIRLHVVVRMSMPAKWYYDNTRQNTPMLLQHNPTWRRHSRVCKWRLAAPSRLVRHNALGSRHALVLATIHTLSRHAREVE